VRLFIRPAPSADRYICKTLPDPGNRRYYRPEDVALVRRIHHLLTQEGYTVRGVQKLLRDKQAQAVEVAVAARETVEPTAPASEPQPGVDVFRLIALRNRLAEALEG
jgi:DNA-binding transcriptional MerR regulator